ncbi:MAG TPA: hypothetical protein VIV12_04880 [Streptosporangiaceae bacterium]
MTGLLPCICSGNCQADSTCHRPPRFQAHLDAARVHKRAEACAGHLGAMVTGLTTWAREHNLTDGNLTVLAIHPPATCPEPRILNQVSQTPGLVFSTIRLSGGIFLGV